MTPEAMMSRYELTKEEMIDTKTKADEYVKKYAPMLLDEMIKTIEENLTLITINDQTI